MEKLIRIEGLLIGHRRRHSVIFGILSAVFSISVDPGSGFCYAKPSMLAGQRPSDTYAQMKESILRYMHTRSQVQDQRRARQCKCGDFSVDYIQGGDSSHLLSSSSRLTLHLKSGHTWAHSNHETCGHPVDSIKRMHSHQSGTVPAETKIISIIIVFSL